MLLYYFRHILFECMVAAHTNLFNFGFLLISGPMAHLIHKVHEQSYIAHVISYAARIGRFRDNQIVQAFLNLFNLN